MADKRFSKHLDELLKTKPFSREILSLSVGFKEIAQPLKFSTRNDGNRGSQQQNVMVSFGTIFFSFSYHIVLSYFLKIKR
jgi:amino acid permease